MSERLRAYGGIVGLLVAGVVLAQVVPSKYVDLLVMFGVYAYISTCWNFIGGLAGKMSLVHGTFFGLGAFVTAALYEKSGVPMLLGLLIVVLGVAVLSWVISRIAFQRQIGGMYFALLTFAFSFVVLGVAQEWQKEYSSVGLLLPIRSEPWNLLFLDQRVYVYIMLGLVSCALVTWHLVKRGRWGYFLEAAREDEPAARSLGINAPRVLTAMMVLSACATALAGAVYAAYLGSLDATYMFSADWTVNILVATIVGGIGRMWGPVVGAAVVTALNELVRSLPSDVSIAGISTLLYGTVLLAVIVLLPGGLTGSRGRMSRRPSFLRRRAVPSA